MFVKSETVFIQNQCIEKGRAIMSNNSKISTFKWLQSNSQFRFQIRKIVYDFIYR